ncbi:MAG: LysR family transcriptional regulator, partial [Arthrobacter koreensis]
CDDFNASLEMAAAGIGAALVPELAMLNHSRGVVVLDVPEIRLARSIFALVINDRQGPRTRVFLDRLADVLEGISISPSPGPAPPPR